MENKAQIRYCRSGTEMIDLVAGLVLDAAREAVRLRGTFALVLSGGNTPKPLFAKFTEPAYAAPFPWGRTHIFWGDERCVPPDSEDSNYRLAHELFLSAVAVPATQVHRLQAEVEPAARAAACYEEEVRASFRHQGRTGFDLILLGMGPDGHVASLFPGVKALEEKKKWVVPVAAPTTVKPAVPRLTMTYPLLNRTDKAVFLLAGRDKRDLAEKIWARQDPSPNPWPAGGITAEGRLYWFICP